MGRTVWRTVRGAMRELAPDPIHESVEVADWRADAAGDYCFRCGASAGPGAVTARGCAFCRGDRLAWDRLTRLGLYEPPLADWIKAMKFAHQWRWGPWLGEQLAAVMPEAFEPARVVVCPVPLHWRRRWSRGYNQARLMAGTLADRRGWLMADLLGRTRPTAPQTTLAVSRRLGNVRNSFKLTGVDLTGWEVMLVDDVMTTGATLSQGVRLLRKAGARSVGVAVAAGADPRGRGFTLIRP